jgi:hypothetical protein
MSGRGRACVYLRTGFGYAGGGCGRLGHGVGMGRGRGGCGRRARIRRLGFGGEGRVDYEQHS